MGAINFSDNWSITGVCLDRIINTREKKPHARKNEKTGKEVRKTMPKKKLITKRIQDLTEQDKAQYLAYIKESFLTNYLEGW